MAMILSNLSEFSRSRGSTSLTYLERSVLPRIERILSYPQFIMYLSCVKLFTENPRNLVAKLEMTWNFSLPLFPLFFFQWSANPKSKYRRKLLWVDQVREYTENRVYHKAKGFHDNLPTEKSIKIENLRLWFISNWL